MASLTVENYVKTIFKLCTAAPTRPASTGQIAAAAHVTPGTVTSMLKTLSEAGLAEYTPYEGVRLTALGNLLALQILRRHKLLVTFLGQTLQMSPEDARREAEDLEHVASDRLMDRIDAFLGHPEADPHGDPIPPATPPSPPPRPLEGVAPAPFDTPAPFATSAPFDGNSEKP